MFARTRALNLTVSQMRQAMQQRTQQISNTAVKRSATNTKVAAEATPAAAAPAAEAAKVSFFKSETWTKAVGTVGALANWTIPLAAITHMNTKPASTIDPKMTSILGIYSMFFIRWAMAVSPANFPLMVCHISNVMVQSTQLARSLMSKSEEAAAAAAAPAVATA